jgi:hypothetical protein
MTSSVPLGAGSAGGTRAPLCGTRRRVVHETFLGELREVGTERLHEFGIGHELPQLAGRLVAVGTTVLGVLVMLALAVARVAVVPPVWLVSAASGLTLAASVLCSRGRLRGRTVGAVDNGSGLVTALIAAETSDDRTGFILTGAEEFGLVGARILAQQMPELVRGRDMINIDTVDDAGIVSIVSHDRLGSQLATRAAQTLVLSDVQVRRRGLLPGIMVDSQAFARAGARAVTIARLNWGTLRRVHTSRDTANGMNFRTARAIGAWLGSVR